MFRIYPENDLNNISELIKKYSIKKIDNSFFYIMIDVESGDLMGFSQFEIYDGYAYIYNIIEAHGKNDYEAMFILTKQTMSFIESCGVSDCRAALDSADEKLIITAGFKKNDNEYVINLSGMFDGHCDNH